MIGNTFVHGGSSPATRRLSPGPAELRPVRIRLPCGGRAGGCASTR